MEEKEILIEVSETNEKDEKAFPFFKILYRNVILIAIATIIGLVAGLSVAFVRNKPVYTAKCDVILKLSLDTNGISSEQTIANSLVLAKNYMRTMADTISAPDTVEKATSYNGNDIRANKIGVDFSSNNMMFTVSYSDADGETAKMKLADVIKASQFEIIERKPVEGTNIMFIETQKEYYVVRSDKKVAYAVAGACAGLGISVIVAFLAYYLDNKVKSEEELEELTGVSLLSYIEKH